MKKVENIVVVAALILLLAVFIVYVCCAIDSVRKDRYNSLREACFDAAKLDIIAEYGFNYVVWLDIEEVNVAPDRDDFYIFTCIVGDKDNLREYRFVVQIRILNGEVDVDTWRIREAT